MSGNNLSRDSAEQIMDRLFTGEEPPELVGAFLTAMAIKRATGSEIAGFATSLRNHALPARFQESPLLDLCGTGGGKSTFNLSTGSSLLAASCGAKIAKHGNRAVTSQCGSADILEAMGYQITSSPSQKQAELTNHGFTFLFAPDYHPAMKAVGPIRRSLGIRTVFNLLGPLANPAHVQRQVLGVFDPRDMEPVAHALAELGTDHSFVVSSHDGLDEISPLGATDYIEVRGKEFRKGSWTPADFGLQTFPPQSILPGNCLEQNQQILFDALQGKDQARSAMLIPNAAVALYLAEIAGSIQDGASLAKESMASGQAAVHLENFLPA